MVNLIIGIVLLLLAVAFLLLGAFLITKRDIRCLILFFVAALFLIGGLGLFNEYNKPHHGAIPSIKDVPEMAHLVEIKTIIGNDTTLSYRIEWNDAIK